MVFFFFLSVHVITEYCLEMYTIWVKGGVGGGGGWRLLPPCNIKEGQNRHENKHMGSPPALTGYLPRGLNSDNFLACSASIRSIVDVYLYGRLYFALLWLWLWWWW